jgi:hypothetical protein
MSILNPEFLDTRPEREQIFRATVPAAVLGIVAGIAVSKSSGLYLLLILLAIAGSVLAGMEHRTSEDAALRGFGAGIIFGVTVLIGHGLISGGAVSLPHPLVLEPVIAAAASIGLFALGARLRSRREPAAT